MTQPIEFPSATKSFALPLLFAGQTQKEFFINQSLVLIDALIGGSVVGSSSSPPINPTEGDAYRVLPNPDGDWAGKADAVAIRIGDAWQFVAPPHGMSVFDQAADHVIIFRGQWESATEVSVPSSGAVIDAEARHAISQIIVALRVAGLLPTT